MSDVVIQSLVNIVPVAALVLGLYYFLTKQMNAMENRLREDARDLENRLREDMRESEDRLRDEIKAVAKSVETAKSELRTEIAALARSVERGDSDLSHRMDRNDDKISRLIQDVGVVQGAVLGVSVEAVPREQPAGTN